MVFLKKIHRQYEIFFLWGKKKKKEAHFHFSHPWSSITRFFFPTVGFLNRELLYNRGPIISWQGRRIYEMGKYISTPYATLGLKHPKHLYKVKEVML